MNKIMTSGDTNKNKMLNFSQTCFFSKESEPVSLHYNKRDPEFEQLITRGAFLTWRKEFLYDDLRQRDND